MLTTDQVDHFRTFGFAVLRGYLADRVSVLRAEVDAAVRDAYAATYNERAVIDGISGFFEASWHTDDGIGVRGVKFAAYFDELDADTGAALRLLPGSHHPEQNTRMAGYSKRRGCCGGDAEFAAYQASFPGYVAGTSPGDVIAFDLHVWHASTGGQDRLAWNAVYLRCPETADERDRTLRSMSDGFEQAFRSFDTGRYPVRRDWLTGAAAHLRRAPLIGRMRRAGVLDLPGALEGW